MTGPRIDTAVEAGDWPPEGALRQLAECAVAAALAALAENGAERDDSLPQREEGSRHAAKRAGSELSILFTDDTAMQALNAKWRGKDKPTNVLSFPQTPTRPPFPLPDPTQQGRSRPVLLGDIVLAAGTVKREAALADKPLEDHIAHLIIHGFLHLLGYDHEAEGEAEEMERLERSALSRIGIPDPYAAAPRP